MSATATTLQRIAPESSGSNIEQLETIVVRDLPKYWKQAYRQLGNAHDAEDAVQDALVSAYKNLSQFKGTAKLSTWFTAIVINAARMHRRRRRPLVSLDEPFTVRQDVTTLLDISEDTRPGPEAICATSELRKLLAGAIDRLSPAARRVVRLYFVHGMSAAEVSQALGISVGTIKSQLARARTKLTKLLRRELGVQVPNSR